MTTVTDAAAFVRRTLVVLGLIALALLLWRVAYALLLAFGGVLLAVLLRGLARKVRDWTPLGIGWSMAVVGVALVGLIVLVAALLGPSVSAQLGELGDTLTQGMSKVRDYLQERPWGQELLSGMTQGAPQGSDLLRAAATVFASALDAVLALVLVIFAGIYFAAAPAVYSDGLVRLLPKGRQARAKEVLDATGKALWLWLLGQFVIMVIVGVLTAVGLLIVGVPLALALGFVAGLLEFIPFIGPIVAAVPIILVALTADPQTALYAALVILAIQQVESHLLAPIVQRKAVTLPPVLVLVGTIALTLLFGPIGAVFATPLLVVVLVVVEMLYMEDTLGQRVDVPGSRNA